MEYLFDPNADPMMAALDLMTGHSLCGNALSDHKRAVAAIRAGRASGLGAEVLEMVKAKRAVALEWTTLTQSKWARETRRPSRARHHDSIAIREKYVRCV